MAKVVIWIIHDSPPAKLEHGVIWGISYVGGQFGATVGEIALSPVRIFAPDALGDLKDKSLWNVVHDGMMTAAGRLFGESEHGNERE